MRRRFDSGYLYEEFERLGAETSDAIDAYLIGGGSMAFRDLKETTKDVDLVVRNRTVLERLQTTLRAIGYQVVHSPSEEYASLGAKAMLENDDGCRFDVFVRQVGGELVFSDGMQQRSEPFVTTSSLTIHLVSLEDIFLFKSVAGRTDDIQDLSTLVQTGLDFKEIEQEIDQQVALLNEEFFISVVNESLIDLEERFGITVPIRDTITHRTNRIYRELEVLMACAECTTAEELIDKLNISSDDLEVVLARLESKGIIERSGSCIETLRERP